MEQERWHSLSIEDALARAGVQESEGLTFAEAQRRLERHGYNELVTEKGPTALQQFIGQFKDFIIWVLIGAAVISGPVLGEWTDAIAILVIVLLNAILGFVQEYRAEQALRALKRLTAPTAQVLREGRLHELPARELVPGDIIAIDTGDLVPADARLTSTRNLALNQAALTGESAPVSKDAATQVPADTALADRDNMIYASTVAVRGRGRAVVVATGMETELGRIARLVQEVEAEATPLQQQLARVGRFLVYAALGIVAVIFLLGIVRGDPIVQMFLVAVSLAVAAIPEGLLAVVTIALALGVRRMAARNALVRRLRSVETLGAASVICSDKTGTLTENQMTVRQIITPERVIQVTGEGYTPRGRFLVDGQPVPSQAQDLQAVLRVGVLASTADLVQENGGFDGWNIRGDPTEGGLLVAAAKAGYMEAEAEARYAFVEELPFDSERKRMSIIYSLRAQDREAALAAPILPGERVAFVKGAPESVLALCTRVQRGGRVLPLGPGERRAFLDVNNYLGGQALRVLAMAYRPLGVDAPLTAETVEQDLIFVGMQAMIDPPRTEADPAVREAQEAGITVVMITGDQHNTAITIARELGIFGPDDVSLTGAQLEEITDERLAEIVQHVRVYARVSPESKLRIVRAWKSRGQVVAMTGDGVNDAPALKEADIGIAMGLTGTDVSKEASDMVLADDNFATIMAAVEEGRTIFDNIRRFVHFMLSCNTGEVLTMFLAGLLGLPLPLLPIQILWINLATDSLPALALGVEKAEPGLMKRPPRPAGEGIINRAIAAAIGWQGLLIGLVTLGAFVLELYGLGRGIERARVLAFSTSILAQSLHAFSLRSNRYSLFTIGLLSNRYMLYAFLAVILSNLAIIYIPFLQPVFATEPLSLADWGVVVGLGLLPLLIVQAQRVIGEMQHPAPA